MFADDHDSDQSISEEEDLGLQSLNNSSFSLSSSVDNKERSIQVLSQLEILRKDAYELGAVTNAIYSEKRLTGLSVEDEIEFPLFGNEDVSINCTRVVSVLDSDEEIDRRFHGLAPICNSDEDIISDEEKLNRYTSGSAKVDREENTWSEVNGEVEALVCLNETTGCFPVGSSSKQDKSSKGGQRKVKPNSLFRFRSHEKAFPVVVADAIETGIPLRDCSLSKDLHASANRDMQKSNTESLQVLNGRGVEKQEQNLLSFEGAFHDCNKHSVTELLECLQEKSGRAQGNSEIHYRLKRRKRKAVVNRNISALGDRNMGILMDSGSSSEDDDVSLNSKSILQQRTIADQFHEAIEAVPQNGLMPDTESCTKYGVGLFEKLQNVMVIEKERDMDFLKELQIDRNSTDGRGFLDVRILARSLEAKLNVCCCALIGDENPQWSNYFQMRNQSGERMLTIIFSSRICSDVELEAGNIIRIHSPWKEVNIKEKEEMVILLSTYFSQM
ncbi:hypothetical protein M9H77_25541 [Catharanthus roseus]|uniref:Uncharacterized protein n=1 Tax=Catharanthus roseus TaxID=4058 RepID=A0ACC0A9T0_CATRO|nr:hypothetical protein M9H77_25541 [Catharanthus roseus]